MIFKKGDAKLDPTTYEGKKKIRKFKESAWKGVYFLSGELLALSVTYNEPWFTNTRNFWVGPGDQVWPDQKIKYVRHLLLFEGIPSSLVTFYYLIYNKYVVPRFKLKAVYMYVAGFYTYSIFALLFWETRRSDFGISMTHHVATVCLIAMSYIFRYTGDMNVLFIYANLSLNPG